MGETLTSTSNSWSIQSYFGALRKGDILRAREAAGEMHQCDSRPYTTRQSQGRPPAAEAKQRLEAVKGAMRIKQKAVVLSGLRRLTSLSNFAAQQSQSPQQPLAPSGP